MPCGIYSITNIINGKQYIGLSEDIYERWGEHKRKLNRNKHINTHLQNAWNKYGEEAFEFKIIKCCKERYLDRFEKLYIDIYDTFKNGYNRHPGGRNYSGKRGLFYGHHHTEEAKKKISRANKGVPCSEETKKKLSIIAKERYKDKRNHPWYGRKHSEESKKKISENHADLSGKNHPMYGKKLPAKTLKKISEALKGYKHTPETVKKMSEAQKRRFSDKHNHPFYGKNHSLTHRINLAESQNSSGILNVCKTRTDNCTQGFIWEYWYYEDGEQKYISAIDLLRLKEKVLNKGFEWIIINEELVKKSLEESAHNTKEKYKNHPTGISRVFRAVNNNFNQGFCWMYRYREDNKYKTLSSVDLYKLKEKVLSKGLDWIIVNEEIAEETFKIAEKQYNETKYKNHPTGILGLYKSKTKNPQGFVWAYDYKVEGKKRTLTSVDLCKLKEKIIAKGFEWIIVNEEKATEIFNEYVNEKEVFNMSGKCDDCNREYVQYKATSYPNEEGYYQTKRYYRCPKCGTVYVEVDPLQDGKHIGDDMVVEKYPVIEKEKTTLDKWM